MVSEQKIIAQLSELNIKAQNLSVDDVIRLALGEIGEKAVFTTSFGAEDQVLTHFLSEKKLPVDLITLDTGRLFQRNARNAGEDDKKYGNIVKVLFPKHTMLKRTLPRTALTPFIIPSRSQRVLRYPEDQTS